MVNSSSVRPAPSSVQQTAGEEIFVYIQPPLGPSVQQSWMTKPIKGGHQRRATTEGSRDRPLAIIDAHDSLRDKEDATQTDNGIDGTNGQKHGAFALDDSTRAP